MAQKTNVLHDADRLAQALGVPARAPADPRLTPIIRAIDQDPTAFPTIAAAAEKTGLSPSHFQALFREATGLPFRRYRQWRRMAQVVHCLRDGASLTTAAYDSGFASSAHLSAAF